MLLVDGYNVLGVNTDVTSVIEALTEGTTLYGDTVESSMYIGMKRSELSQEGFFDDASASINDALNDKQGEERIVCLGYEGNTIGEAFTGCQAPLESSFTRIASRGKLHRASATYKGNGIVEDGVILHALTERTANGNTQATPVDNTAATDYGGAVYLQLSALTLGGYTNIIVTVRQSANNVDWENLVAFTAVTAANTAERKTIAAGVGSMKRYLAVSWAFTGTGSDPSATFLVGAVRNAS